jgi:signal peptidase II
MPPSDHRAPVERAPTGETSASAGSSAGHARASWLNGPWLRAALVLVLVVAADQLSKHAVENSIVQGEERKLLPGVQLVDTRNNGIAFGFLPGSHVAVTIAIGVALVALLVYFALHSHTPLIWLPTGMLIGGAIGNVADRVRAGSVTDFIKLPLGWPPFNLADMSITLGVVILFLVIDHSRHGAQA